jgi:hypothetical protein
MKLIRSLMVLIVLTAMVSMTTAVSVAAQDGAATMLDGFGYPELSIDISEAGFVLPSAVPAGRTLITLHNTGTESRHAFLARLPDDVTIGELFAQQQDDVPPAWLWQSSFPGFPGETLPGESRQALVDLTPGLYLILEDHVGIFVVQPGDAATPSPVADPPSAATISLFEFGFELPDNLTAGDQIWTVVNAGRVPHELLLASVPEGTTNDDVMNMLGNDTGEAVPVGGIGWLSPGGTGWTEVDLAAGTYVALCFVFDPDTGMPHAMEGMVQVFTIA